MIGAALTRLRARLASNDRGVAAVEFAIVLPLLLTMYIGGYALSDMISCNRKVTIATRELTDLATRSAYLTQADCATILGAATQVMQPYSGNNATERLSEVLLTDATHAKVIWSQALNGTAYSTDPNLPPTIFTVPAGLGAVGSYLVLGEVSYAYRPVAGFHTSTSLNLYDKIYMSPRLSQQIPLQ